MADGIGGLFYQSVTLFTHQGQQGFGKAGQIPLGNCRLVGKRIAAPLIDGAIHFLRVKLLHKCTRAVVDGFTRDAAVIRIHDAVNKAHAHPARNQHGLAGHHRFKQRQIRVFRAGGLWIVARNHMVRQCF